MKLSIYARNCEIRRIDRSAASVFLSQYHRLGATRCRYCYGIFVKRTTGRNEMTLPPGTLVGVSAFSNARRWLKGDRVVSSYEWVRYASLSEVRVLGGMSRTLKQFILDKSPDDVMSYADASYPDGGKTYEKLGFKLESIVEKPGFKNLKYRLEIKSER